MSKMKIESITVHTKLEANARYINITYQRDRNGNVLVYSGKTLIATVKLGR